MNNKVLALRNRTVQINTENITNIRITQPANHLNSTTISEACLTKNFSFKERLQILKAELLNQSAELDRAINGTHNSMAYEFPMKQAMLCIPEFNGDARDLDGFLYQIEYFANQIPEGEAKEDLIRTVMFKLKGKAAGFFNRSLEDTWEKVKMKLIRQFGENLTSKPFFNKLRRFIKGSMNPSPNTKKGC